MRRLFAALVFAAACTDPSVFEYELRTGILTGTVLYRPAPASDDPCTPSPARGNVIVTLFAADRLPPPQGTSGPVNFIVVPEDQMFAGAPDERGLYAAPFVMPTVPAGRYQVRAFLDADGDFNPTIGLLAQPSAGDVAGGYVDPVSARFLEVEVAADWESSQVTVTLARTIVTDRPAFAITSSAVLEVPFATPRALVLTSHPIERPGISLSAQCTRFVVTFADDDGDGVTDDANEDHLPDLYPRVVLRRQPTPDDARTVLVPGIVNPFPFLDALEGAGAALTDVLELIVPPVAVERTAVGDVRLPAVPPGRYDTVVILATGQTWQVPNDLDVVQPAGGPDPTQSLSFEMRAGQPLPAGSVSGRVRVDDPTPSEVYVFAFRAADPPPPAGSGRPVALASLDRAALVAEGAGRSAAFAIDGLADGAYLVGGLADLDGDFSPLVDLVAQPSAGDRLSRALVPVEVRGGAATVGVEVLVDRIVAHDRPAFAWVGEARFSPAGGFGTLMIQARAVPRLGIDVVSARVPVGLAGTDLDADNFPDLLPRVVLTKMVDTGDPRTAPHDPEGWLIPAVVDPLPFVAALAGGSNTVTAGELLLRLPPVAVRRATGERIAPPPPGRYRVNLLSATGQTWSVPSSLDVLLARVGTPLEDPSQAAPLTVEPAPLGRGVISGTVQLQSAPPAGEHQVIVLAFDRNRPPPPLGDGRPVATTIVPKSAFSGMTAPYTLAGLGTGRYEVRAFLDADDDFVPWLEPRNQPDRGDVGGGFVQLPQGILQEVTVDAQGAPVTGVGVTILDAALYATDRPAFGLSPASPTLRASTGSVTFTLAALSLTTDVWRGDGIFPVRWADLDGDGSADDRNRDGVFDVFPLIVAERLADGDDLALDPAGYRLAGVVDPRQFAPLGFPVNDPSNVQATVVTSNVRVVFVPIAVTAADPTTPIAAPAGRYRVTAINPRGQTWTIPNELTRAAGTPLPSTQGSVLTIAP